MGLASKLSCILSIIVASHLANAAELIKVTDEKGMPVVGAQILIGTEDGKPFGGNVITTNGSGTAAAPAGWTTAQPVTAQSPGFMAATIPDAKPGALTIQMTRLEGQNQFEISGNTEGFGKMVNNGLVHFGLVIPALRREEFLSFDMSTVLSPQSDRIDVIGNSFEIPSNLTMPEQTVTYIFDIKLNKPKYRFYVRNPGQYVMSATHGSFPLSKVAGDIRSGKSIFELINHLTFLEGGERALSVSGHSPGNNLMVNQAPFSSAITVKAPAFPKNQVMVSLALQEKGGLLMPTDLKRFQAGQSMNLRSASTPSVLSLLMVNANAITADLSMETFRPLSLIDSYYQINGMASRPQSFSQLSFVISQASGGANPNFLSLVNSPVLDAQNVLNVTAPQTPAGVTPAGAYFVFSEIETFPNGKVTSEQRTRLWEVWSPNWPTQVQLPKLTFNRKSNRTYRWEVLFLGSSSGFSGSTHVNGVDLKSVTHVTRNALDF